MIKFIFLGMVQGLTEFLPVSSSGHLVVLQQLLGIESHQVAISVVLHLGTLLALVVFFYPDIFKLWKDFKMMGLVLIVVVITGTIGVLGKDFFESLFSSSKAVGLGWIFTGALLLLTKRIKEFKRDNLKLSDAIILGFTQALAIIPGVSRSGITLATLFFRKVDRALAFSFSFLVAIPIILGAALLEAKEIRAVPSTEIGNLVVGFVFSCLAGLLALRILKTLINQAKLYYFGYYCIFMALVTLLFLK